LVAWDLLLTSTASPAQGYIEIYADFDLITYRGFGVVKSIRTAGKPEGFFNASKGQTVVDWRFRDLSNGVNAVTYRWSNAFPAAVTDPIIKEKFNATRERNKRHLRLQH
jgi:hypothetical protein